MASIPSPVMDAILPPSLAYEIGRDAEKRAVDVREGRATMEGRFVEGPWGREYELQRIRKDLTLTEKHPKRPEPGLGPVADFVRRTS